MNPILLFCMAQFVLIALHAMESENPKSKPVKIFKVYSASCLNNQKGITTSHEHFENVYRETITKLRNRFSQLRYSITYGYAPPSILQEKREIDCGLKADDLIDEIDRYAFYRKNLLQNKYSWPKGSQPPSDIFFNMQEGVLPDELSAQILEIERQNLPPQELQYLIKEEEKLKKECARLFVLKKIFEPTKFHFLTNIYGDIKGLMKVLEQWEKDGVIDNDLKILNNNAIICLGNCGNEGVYSSEVWYTLLCLANANLDKFFLIRGAQEHVVENITGLYDEAKIKFDIESVPKKKEKKSKKTLFKAVIDPNRKENKALVKAFLEENAHKKPSEIILERMNSLYRLLPVAMFIGIKNKGKNYTQYVCASRGLELGYQGAHQLLADDNTQMCQWLTHINRSEQIKKLPMPVIQEINNVVQDGTHDNLVKEVSTEKDVPITDIKDNKFDPAVYNLGFCHDSFQDDEKKIGYDDKSKSWQWSKELTRAVLNLWSKEHKSWFRTMIMWLNYPLRKLFDWGFNNPTHTVVAHVGAYQGVSKSCPPLMRNIISNKGVYNMWDHNQKAKDIIPLVPGSAVTILGFPDNQHGYLRKVGKTMEKVVRKKLPVKEQEKSNKEEDTQERSQKKEREVEYIYKRKYLIPFTFATIATLTFDAAKTMWQMTRKNIKVIDIDKKSFHIKDTDSVVGIEEYYGQD